MCDTSFTQQYLLPKIELLSVWNFHKLQTMTENKNMWLVENILLCLVFLAPGYTLIIWNWSGMPYNSAEVLFFIKCFRAIEVNIFFHSILILLLELLHTKFFLDINNFIYYELRPNNTHFQLNTCIRGKQEKKRKFFSKESLATVMEIILSKLNYRCSNGIGVDMKITN